MMKFYVLDDLIGSVKVISKIIESRGLGEVIGTQTDSEKGIHEILSTNPDIVIVDLLMPVKDGITVVNEVKAINPDIDFIMISQVTEKNMISDAYTAGVEYYITKPNNLIEIENVIRRTVEKREMGSILNGIRSVIGTPQNISSAASSGPSDTEQESLSKMKKILGSMGMLGESGTKDIINVCRMMMEEDLSYKKATLNEYASLLGEDPKIVKQRIRRAVKKGLTNTAALGIEDYYTDTFDQYAHSLFNFDAVRSEMDLLRGKSPYGGRPSIDKFFEGLQLLCES